MPYIISGKITDELGFPLQQAVVIKEVPKSGITGMADVVASLDGTFQFTPLSLESTIEISSFGYDTQPFPPVAVPAVVMMEPSLIIEGTPTKKEDNTLLYVGLGVAAIAGIALLMKKSRSQTQPSAPLQAPVVIKF